MTASGWCSVQYIDAAGSHRKNEEKPRPDPEEVIPTKVVSYKECPRQMREFQIPASGAKQVKERVHVLIMITFQKYDGGGSGCRAARFVDSTSHASTSARIDADLIL